jgi:hypothetical protein
MKTLTIYLENSVIGGYFDKIFREDTHKLFELFKDGTYIPVISSHVIQELERGAPSYVIENLKSIDYIEYAITQDMLLLTEKYMKQNIVSENYRDDALHIAIATIIEVDVLVSWNFTHILNLNRIKKFNSVNLYEGYRLLEIRNPREVLNYVEI